MTHKYKIKGEYIEFMSQYIGLDFLIDNESQDFYKELWKFFESQIIKAVREADEMWEHILKREVSDAKDQSRKEERKQLKLKAQAIGTPDGYVNIENLFKDTPDMNLKEVLKKI